MRTVAGIFDQLGGVSAVARMMGVRTSTASEMKRRGKVMPEYWPDLITAASTAGHSWLTYEYLALIHAVSKGRPLNSDAAARAKAFALC